MTKEVLALVLDELGMPYEESALSRIVDALDAYEDSSDIRYQALGEKKFNTCNECERLKI